MNASSYVPGEEPDSNQAIRRAIAQRSLIVVTARTRSGWMMLKSRFLPSLSGNVLRIERPRASRNRCPRFACGQSVGLSFRVGLTKCALETEVLDAGTDGIEGPLTLRWPDSVQQLQRRMYVRIKIPTPLSLPLIFHRAHDSARKDLPSPDAHGTMLDISPGGLGAAVSGGRLEDWRTGQTVRVQLEPGRPHTNLVGRICYARPWDNDTVRVGLQFADARAARMGRTAHRQIAQAASQLRRGALRHAPASLP